MSRRIASGDSAERRQLFDRLLQNGARFAVALHRRASQEKASGLHLRRAMFLPQTATNQLDSAKRSSLTIARPQPIISGLEDFETIAQEVSGLGQRVSDLEKRLEHVEQVNTGLEEAALTTARALQEISAHWDKVYEAMRRKEASK